MQRLPLSLLPVAYTDAAVFVCKENQPDGGPETKQIHGKGCQNEGDIHFAFFQCVLHLVPPGHTSGFQFKIFGAYLLCFNQVAQYAQGQMIGNLNVPHRDICFPYVPCFGAMLGGSVSFGILLKLCRRFPESKYAA
ncbi:MAG: hypothetical protein B6245_04765 [Desulfobacteraceae bacterium 4572_88]|nr:MAG: hypothetical protein B6245_04765 [Desulfobacteraceae bacterium 4572_88]